MRHYAPPTNQEPTMNTEKMREEFEKIFPPSPEFYWDEDKGRYAGDKHYGPGFSYPTNENSARLQMLRLEGFMAARTVVQGEPVAWLVTKGRMFKDRAFISERGAKESALERKDGAIVQPLYAAPQPVEGE